MPQRISDDEASNPIIERLRHEYPEVEQLLINYLDAFKLAANKCEALKIAVEALEYIKTWTCIMTPDGPCAAEAHDPCPSCKARTALNRIKQIG